LKGQDGKGSRCQDHCAPHRDALWTEQNRYGARSLFAQISPGLLADGRATRQKKTIPTQYSLAQREPTVPAINIEDKLALFSEHWSPKIVASFNEHDVMVVKLKGDFVWHSHAETDDFFFVVKGNLTIKLRDGDVLLGPGELYVVPKGVEHCPVAAEEVHLLLIEPAGTPNTGNPATAAVKVRI
jgi:mannose-6-phosphate isomerase-like protein (cupin superfamily)